MKSINQIFSSREIAIIIWLFILLAWALSKGEVRKTFFDVLKAFIAKPVIISTVLMILYISLMVFSFYEIGFWDTTNIKDTIIWSVAIAFVMLVNINKASDDEYYFRNTILDSIKLVIILEFIINVYTFNLLVELILTPVLAILGGMLVIAESDSKYKQVEKLINGTLAVIGVSFIVYAIYYILIDFSGFATAGNLAGFLLPPIFTIVFLPFIYVMALFTKYEILFVRMGFFIRDADLLKYAKRKIFFAFHFDLKSLNEWSKNLGLIRVNNKNDVISAIKEFKKNVNKSYSKSLNKDAP